MKKWIITICVVILSVILIFVSLISYGIYWAFFDIQGINGQEIIKVSDSPDSSYTVTAYLNSGGATTGWAVLCSVKNNETGKERNIYWQYQCSSANIYWTDNDTVWINGVSLDVNKKEIYDYRRE